MWYKNIAGRFFGLVTKHACDRRTDRQNYDSKDRANIAASHGENALHTRLTSVEIIGLTNTRVTCEALIVGTCAF